MRTAMPSAAAPPRSLPLVGLVPAAVAGAIVLNGVLYYVFLALDMIPQEVIVPNAGAPITLAPVVVSSAVTAAGGVLLYALMRRFLTGARRIFTGLALLLLLVSFAMPLGIPAAPVKMLVALNVMHIAVAAVVLGLVWYAPRRSETPAAHG